MQSYKHFIAKCVLKCVLIVTYNYLLGNEETVTEIQLTQEQLQGFAGAAFFNTAAPPQEEQG